MALANGNHEAYTPQSILVTGGAGFIASHVTKLLVTKYPQYKVEALRTACCLSFASRTTASCTSGPPH